MAKDAISIIISNEADITIDLDRKIKKLLCNCFPKDETIFSQTRYWNDVIPKWSVMIEENQTIIAYNAIIEREIIIGSDVFSSIGIGNVCVDSEYQGRSLAKILMEKSIEQARKSKYDLGFLFCKEKIKDIYQKSGWQVKMKSEERLA